MSSVSGALTSAYLRPEASYAVYPSSTWTDANCKKLHFSSLELPLNKSYIEDPALLGNTYPADKIPTASIVNGSIKFSVHPEQMGWLLYLSLGGVKDTKKAPQGSLVISYNGASASCLIEKVGDEIRAYVGNSGSEILDTNFNATGVIDVTAMGFTTIALLVTAINGYTGYNAYYIGDSAALGTLFSDFAQVQAKKQSVKIEAINDAYIMIKYVGAQASALLSKSGNNLTSKIGAVGAEAPDVAFGTAGVLDLSSASFDTLTELAAEIDGYADYEATVVKGGAFTSGWIADFTDTQFKTASGLTKQASDPSATAYRHRFIPTQLGASKRSFSMRVNKGVENLAYVGCKFGEFNLDMTPRAILTGDATIVAKEIQTVAQLTGITTEQARAFVTSNIKMYIDGELTADVKKVGFKNNPNLDIEDTIIGSEYIAEPENQQANCTLETDFRYNSDTAVYRTAYEAGTEIEIVLYGESNDEVETGKKYSFWLRLPRAKITALKADITNPQKIIMPATVEIMTPIFNSFDAIEWDLLTKEDDYTV